MIDNAIGGFHSTVFCYGQTGSGKTFTMDGLKYKKNEKGLYVPIVNDDSAEASKENNGLV